VVSKIYEFEANLSLIKLSGRKLISVRSEYGLLKY